MKENNVKVEEVVDNKISETKALEEKNSQLEKTLALLQAQIANMQAQMSQAQPKVQVVQKLRSGLVAAQRTNRCRRGRQP